MAIKSKHEDNTCLTYTLAKVTNQVSLYPAQYTRQPSEYVYLDLINNIIAYNSNQYICHFLNNTTHFNTLYMLNGCTQPEVIDTIQAFTHLIKT